MSNQTISIIYATKTGHSRKIAKAIGSALNVTPIDIKSGEKPKNTDLLFIVGGLYGNESAPEMISYIEALNQAHAKKAVLITSCASKTAKQNKVRELLIAKGIKVLAEEFICQGSFLIMGFMHPDKVDIQNAIDFAKRITYE